MSHNPTPLDANTKLELPLRRTADVQFREVAIHILTKGTMNERQFEPGEPGSCDPAWDHRGGTPEKAERRQAGTPATLVGNIDNAIDEIDDSVKRRLEQSYPVRLLKQRYGLSRNYAAFIAAEFRWGDAR
jgi:hypothetical protein